MASGFPDGRDGRTVQDGKPGSLKIRSATFTPEEYPTPEDQYEAVCDLIRGCRFADCEYYVFCDGRLVVNF